MNRFQKKNQSFSFIRGLFIPLCIFMLIFGFFYFGISSISQTTASEEKQSLETALQHAIVHCYAIEGSYPPNLGYLLEHYPITYDPTAYFVDYQPFASNIMPDVTVLYLEDPS